MNAFDYLPLFIDDLIAEIATRNARCKRNARDLARIAFLIEPSLREAK
jgi:hypothetical protein